MSKIGLVLSGGGGKGAYEIGVWQAFKEYGFDKKIDAVSGTSVGGLNAVLFAKGDFQQALKVWEDMSPQKILQVDVESIVKALASIFPQTRVPMIIGQKIGILKSEGIFTQNGLEEIIRDSLQTGEIKDTMPCYICATHVSKIGLNPHYQKLNHLDYETSIQYLLATSAIPAVFTKIEIENKRFLDGFLTDNIPVKPLVEDEGCDTIITVLLDRDDNIEDMKSRYPSVNFWEITPSKESGGLLAGLDFKRESAIKLIELGYKDTKKILQEVDDFTVEKEKTFTKELVPLHLQKELMLTIDKELEQTLQSIGSHSLELQKFAFDGITSLAATEGKIAHQREQSRFSKIIGSLSGSNISLQTSINSNFEKAIYANTQMIKMLNAKGELALDISIALENKIKYTLHTQESLQQVNAEQYEMLQHLKDAILSLANHTKQAISSNRERIEMLEKNQELLHWNHHLKANIRGMNSFDALLKIVGSYYKLIEKLGIRDSDSDFLYASLLNIGFDSLEINTQEFLSHIKNALTPQNLPLFSDLSTQKFLPLLKTDEEYFPLLTSMANLYNKEKKEDTESFNIEMKGVDVTMEIYHGVKTNTKIKQSFRLEKEKKLAKLQRVSELLKVDGIDAFEDRIERLVESIKKYKVVVPVIGKFSAGKSYLLNRYISDEKIFESESTPTTALATEIHYAKSNSVEFYAKNGDIKKLTLQEAKNISTAEEAYAKYFLNYDILKQREDILLVDMPGYDSSNLQHNNAINRYFNRGSHYILVVDCESASDNSVLKHIKEILSYGAKFSIIITKIDLKQSNHIDEIAQNLKENILKKYPNEEFFLGRCSADKSILDDFHRVIDTIYKESASLFVKEFQRDFKTLFEDILNYYDTLIDRPDDTIELENQISEQEDELKRSIIKIEEMFYDIEYDIIPQATAKLTDKATNVLEINTHKLIKAAKANSLNEELLNILRAPVNAIYKNITHDIVEKAENELLNISKRIDISLSQVNIDTQLSLWEKLKDLFTNQQEKDIKNELQNRVIPQVLQEIELNIERDIKNIFTTIDVQFKQRVEEKEQEYKKQAEQLREELKMKTEEFAVLQKEYRKRKEQISKEQ